MREEYIVLLVEGSLIQVGLLRRSETFGPNRGIALHPIAILIDLV